MLKGDTGAKRTWFYENGAFVAAALAAVLWHVVLSTNVGDDMVYFKTLLDGNSSLGEILAHRYETWSSRMVIEAVLIPLVHCPLLWKILDIVIFTSLPVLLCGLLGVTGRGRWFVTGLVLLYPEECRKRTPVCCSIRLRIWHPPDGLRRRPIISGRSGAFW